MSKQYTLSHLLASGLDERTSNVYLVLLHPVRMAQRGGRPAQVSETPRRNQSLGRGQTREARSRDSAEMESLLERRHSYKNLLMGDDHIIHSHVLVCS